MSETDSQDTEIALVLSCYAAYAEGDFDRAVAPLHPDVEWIEPEEFLGGGRRQGPQAVAEYLRASWEQWAELVSEPTAYRRGGDIVVVHRVHGRLTDGTEHRMAVADVFTLRDGQVVRMHAYADPDQVPPADG